MLRLKKCCFTNISCINTSDKTITFDNLPYLQDITTMFELLGSMGVDIVLDESMKFSVDSSNIKTLRPI